MQYNDTFARTKFVDPIWVTTSLWFFVILGTTTTELTPLTPAFLIFLIIGVGSHLCGMVIRRVIGRKRGYEFYADSSGLRPHLLTIRLRIRKRLIRVTWCLLAFLIVGMVYFLWAYSKVIPSFDTVGFLAARLVYLEEVRGIRDKLFIYTTHLTLLGIVVIYYASRAYRELAPLNTKASKIQVNLAAIITLAISILTTGRTAPLLVILSYSFYCLRFSLYKKKTIVTAFCILSVCMFFVIAFALGKEGLGESNSTSTGESLINIVRIYFFSAPAAMQEVFINNQVVSNVCSNIFSYPIDLMRKLGMFAQCDVRDLEFVFVPVATNVFTFLRAYWEDFGWAYPVAMFTTGYLIETVHIRAFQRPAYSAFIFPFILNSIILQIFEEQLFANASVLAYLTAIYVALSFPYRLPTYRIRSGVNQLSRHLKSKLI